MTLLDRLVPTVGDVILNRYELVQELGRGGFGVVYRATQRGLDEDVALKLLLPQLVVNPEAYQRFVREVQVAKRLRHPNSVRILDCSQTAEGLPFYVMEFVKGEPLDSVLKREGWLSAARARGVATQILKSLAEAHSHGVVHRDLKPANVMLCDIFGEHDFVKVLDFGIAKALAEPTGSSHQTVTGMILGTPAYMSPEQALGQREIDGRSDLYSVGLILAECLHGRPVVRGENALVLLAQHGSKTPLHFPDELQLSPLWPVIDQATQKQREFRFRDATAMRKALEGLGKLPGTDLMLGKPVSDATPMDTPLSLQPEMPASTEELLARAEALTAQSQITPGEQPGDESKRSRLSYLLVAVLFLALSGAIAAVVTFGSKGRESTESEAQATTGSQALVDAGSDGGETTGFPSTGTPTPESVQASLPPSSAALAAMATTVAVAADRLRQSVPLSHRIRFEGTDDVRVTINGQLLGVTPFDGLFPRIARPMELHFEREGYRSSNASVSMLEEVVQVDLRRRRSDRPNPPTTPEPEEEPPATPAPFGHAPIDNQ